MASALATVEAAAMSIPERTRNTGDIRCWSQGVTHDLERTTIMGDFKIRMRFFHDQYVRGLLSKKIAPSSKFSR